MTEPRVLHEIKKLKVVQVGCKVPKISINVNDHDYDEKSSNPNNYVPAVLCQLPNGNVTPVIVSADEAANIKVGQELFVI